MRFQTLYEGRWIFAVIFALGVAGWLLHWPWLAVLAGVFALVMVGLTGAASAVRGVGAP